MNPLISPLLSALSSSQLACIKCKIPHEELTIKGVPYKTCSACRLKYRISYAISGNI